jgi:UDP-N-acetylglucosamine--N-acetylmuramyl-(pentapeptide) pyrophosphoryl-undecaprenol N-acetylglucosamine transferase
MDPSAVLPSDAPCASCSPNAPMTASSSVETATFIFAGGGTGGHLYPGLAVAEALQKLLPSSRIFWAATPRPIDQRLLADQGEAYIRQEIQPFPRNPLQWKGFYGSWRRACRFWDEFFSRHQVSAVLALGGYAAAPAGRVAAARNIPLALLNPDAKMGLANRYLARRANVIFTQWAMDTGLAGDGRCMVTGVPLRPSLFHRSREKSLAALGLSPDRRTLVITGASLGAGTINDAWCQLMRDEQVRNSLQNPAAPWQVLHLTGTSQYSRVRQAAEASGADFWTVLDYCDDMGSVWAAADLAITRAGAGLCAELEACGVPAILLPYPYHRDRHQRANAARLVAHGAAVMLEDQRDAGANAAAIRKLLLDLLSADGRRKAMRDAGLANGKTTAAEQIGRWLYRASGRMIA